MSFALKRPLGSLYLASEPRYYEGFVSRFSAGEENAEGRRGYSPEAKLKYANGIDTGAQAGDQTAQEAQAQAMKLAEKQGLPASSATCAALMLMPASKKSIPIAGGDRQYKFTENNSPFPVDRVFLNYHDFRT